MKRRTYGRDAGLTVRMLFTGGLLGLLYVVFAVVLFNILNVGLVPMLLIVVGLAFFQYYTSDKLALRAAGAKIVEPRGGARAARHGRAAVRDGRPAEAEDRDHRHAGPERVRDRPLAQARRGRVTTGLWNRLEPAEIEGVLAHELSHIANRDVLIMTVASFFAMLAAMLTASACTPACSAAATATTTTARRSG